MQAIDIRNPGERKKLIGAAVLGLLAIILLWWAFVGFGSSSTPTKVATTRVPSRPAPSPVSNGQSNSQVDNINLLRRIDYEYRLPAVPEAKRNIFVYYVPPKPPAVEVRVPPTPTPTPVPPVLLASVNPSSVFARTSEFALEVTGDKFTPQLRVLIDNNPVTTRYRGAQQLSATVPAAVIVNPVTRQVILRSPDGSLYSNVMSFNVAAPPVPNYSYVGILGTTRYTDTAILQDKSSKEMLNAQRGDLLGGRFRITSISEKEIVMMDTNLKIRHAIALTSQGDRSNPSQRPAPRVESEDDEP